MTSDPLAYDTTEPTSARGYGWLLGGKDNYEIDRLFVQHVLQQHPGNLDIARDNRRFLGRAVRHLAEQVGIRQFIDMGCGLPTDNNVHQVAQQALPDARVVYVDNDPIVLAHGRALLAGDDRTTVITADMRDPEAVLSHPDTRRLIDFSEPYAVLFLSVGHHLTDADGPRRIIDTLLDAGPHGCHVAFSQVVDEIAERGQRMSREFTAKGIPWQSRTPAEVDELLTGLKPVEPGLVNLRDWRPTDASPELAPVPPELWRFVGASEHTPESYEYGGVLHR
ncbi:SAM-dependent methyltransferase [Spirillospora sp. CA-253888]